MRRNKLNSFFSMNMMYTDLLTNHGVRHQPANKQMLDAEYGNFSVDGEQLNPPKKQMAGYDNVEEFRYNVKAPIQIPIVILSSHLRAITNCIENTLHLAINLATLDFNEATNNVINILNNIFGVILNTVKAIMDIILSLIQLPVCSALTLKDWIAPQEQSKAELSKSDHSEKFFPCTKNMFPKSIAPINIKWGESNTKQMFISKNAM